MRLAVIPARGGSKRIPRKNIRPFLGKPIIAYSIEAAIQSGCFDKVIVSTDDEGIAEVARELGAEIPFVRPASLSDDYCATTDVIKHAIEWYEQQGQSPEHVCCIYATAPFVSAERIREGWEKLQQSPELKYAFSITSFAFPIQRAVQLDAEQRVSMFQPEHYLTRSQDLPEAFHDAGQFYWGTSEAFKENAAFFKPWSAGIYVPRDYVQDIDTEEDWGVAERKFKTLILDQATDT
ncbi:MAG: pseudaminic acid cytidylyltransferase [Alteromonadaceae bacterium]|nr:MAG: pseudaminic acid cytidylyltransferase [Alteromonadaceae bacterium]